MAKEILSEILIEGEEVSHFTSVTIHQQFNDHHRFEMIVSQEVFEKQGDYTLGKSKQLIGRSITISFGEKSTSDNVFKGIITEVEMKQDQGLWGNVVLKGYSPTYLLEGGYHYESYYKKNLKSIVDIVKSELPPNDMQFAIDPKYTSVITYTTQYRESNFEFMNRLAVEYGEWFYYDGEKLFFGKPSEQRSVELKYGANVQNMSFSMRVVPTHVVHYSYNSENDEVNQSLSPPSVDSSNEFVKHVTTVSDSLYQQVVNQPADIRTPDKKRLDDYAKMQKGGKTSGTVKLSAEGDHPEVALGCHVVVKIIQKELQELETPEHGEYLVTSVSHYLTGTGEYTNSFEAIPSDSKVIPAASEKPLAETQMAIVKDNNDPLGFGRVRVQMLWQQENNEMTDWLRVLTPDAGSSDAVSKNRGFVFIPEVNDQVLIGFRYNDPNRPFVLGSMFHGKIAEGGGGANNGKSLTSKSGHTITMNDGGGMTMDDKTKLNHLKIDGNKSITITAAQKITLTTGKATITMDGDKITIHANTIEIADKNGKSSTIDIKGKETNLHTDTCFINSGKSNKIVGGKNEIEGEGSWSGGNVFIN